MRLQPSTPVQAHFSSTTTHPRRLPQLGHHATSITTTTHNHSSPAPTQGIRPQGSSHHQSRDTRDRSSRASWSPQYQGPLAIIGTRDAGRSVAATNTDRTLAPIARQRNTISRPHEARRRSRSPDRPRPRPHPATTYRLRSPEFVRRPDPGAADSYPRSRLPSPRDRLRDHEAVRSAQAFDTAPSHPRYRTFIEHSGPPNPRSSPPYRRQRPRSRSPPQLAYHYNRPRLESSPRRTDREPYIARSPTWSIHTDLSLHQRERPSRRREAASPPPPTPPEPGLVCNPNSVPLGRRRSSRVTAGDCSVPNPPRVSTPPRNRTSFPLHGGQESVLQRTFCEDVSAPDLGGAGYDHFQAAPRSRRQSGSRPRNPEQAFLPKSKGISDRPQHREGPPEAATGANSIEVNMSARGNFRGPYGGQYPPRGGHFNHGPNDQRNFAHPASGSSPSQSSYASGRGNWAGQQQVSPQK